MGRIWDNEVGNYRFGTRVRGYPFWDNRVRAGLGIPIG